MSGSASRRRAPPPAADLPRVEELRPAPAAESCFARFAALPHCLWLDSAAFDPQVGKYSFLAADPFDYLECPLEGADALPALAGRLRPFLQDGRPELPPFQGGAAGILSYELGRQIEAVPPPRYDEFGLPALAMGLYDVVLAFDHLAGRAWLISQGLPEFEPSRRRARAAARAAFFHRLLAEPPRVSGRSPTTSSPPLSSAVLAPQFPARGPASLNSSFSREGYLAAVRRIVDYIRAGDVFQVNLAQRLIHPAVDDAAALYRRLRQRNAAPFAGYFDGGRFQVVSASPERFLKVVDGLVQTRPIKGTAPRPAERAAARAAARRLLESEKDRAENVMIVDLMRNDLAKVCRPESVVVAALCRLETYRYVHHLVSVVEGRLAEGNRAVDLIAAAFPGGSITGAPKVRAMEIVAELEPTARGAYCGSMGYVGFDGTMDLSILIRTITAARGWWQLPVGGGVVIGSDPEREYEETWHKAEGLIRALR